MIRLDRLFFTLTLFCAAALQAEPPGAAYIFPAGARRGETVDVRIGGYYLHERAAWEMRGEGVTAEPEVSQIERIWFEGPLIKQPASQQKEDYPRDYAGRVSISADAPLGTAQWSLRNGQGITSPLPFVIGDLPETTEREFEGTSIPVEVSLPITINGRIFPREDLDEWTFTAQAGETIVCSVMSQQLGSPLEAQLEVRGPNSRIVAESAGGIRPEAALRFTAAESGTYTIRIGDIRAQGGPQFTYRLTVTNAAWLTNVFPLGGRRGEEITFELTGANLGAEKLATKLPDLSPGIIDHAFSIGSTTLNPIRFDLDDLPESHETTGQALAIPGVMNGCIETPGDRDEWTFSAKKGEFIRFELRAARLGSFLDGTLLIKNAEGKELAKAESLAAGSSDCELEFKAPADGTYAISVQDRFASRGGKSFAYRLRATPSPPDFQLSLALDTLMVEIGGEKKLPVQVRRLGGFNQPIKLSLGELPAGITAAEVTVPANQNKGELVVKIAADVPVQWPRVQVKGNAELEGRTLERSAHIAIPNREPSPEPLQLAAALPTPFRFHSEYQLRYIPRGGTLKKTFVIDRKEFTGPLEVRLADRQGRHLQGVTGPVVSIAPEQNEFDYEAILPPWMELGRTSRTNLMLTGETKDAAGKSYKVCFSTSEQNEQLIAIVSPAPLRLSLENSLLSVSRDSKSPVRVRIHRDRSLGGPCRLELVAPAHVRDTQAEPIEISADHDLGELTLRFGPAAGPFNAPLVIRGTTLRDGVPFTAEVALECRMLSEEK